MNHHSKSTKAFLLSMIAGFLIICNTILLGVAATWFPEIIPALPGETANDTQTLYTLTVISLILGALILLAAIMLLIKPENKKV